MAGGGSTTTERELLEVSDEGFAHVHAVGIVLLQLEALLQHSGCERKRRKVKKKLTW